MDDNEERINYKKKLRKKSTNIIVSNSSSETKSQSKSKSQDVQECSRSEAFFSQRIVSMDFYNANPNIEFDAITSESDFNSRVPVLRIFGSTPKGQKTCTHVHGVYPYITIPYLFDIPDFQTLVEKDLNKALNEFLQSAIPNNKRKFRKHVFKTVKVFGRTYYGFSHTEKVFLRIYFFNPLVIKKAADLLVVGSVLNQKLQPHESHIQFHLQFMIDYNLYGMNLVNYSAVKFRRSPGMVVNDSPVSTFRPLFSSSSGVSTVWDLSQLPESLFSKTLEKISVCELEIDVIAADIIPHLGKSNVRSSNPGIDAIWQDEMERRRNLLGEGLMSQISIPDSPPRTFSGADFTTEALFKEILQEKLLALPENFNTDNSLNETGSLECDTNFPASQVINHLNQSITIPIQKRISNSQDHESSDDELYDLFKEFMKEKNHKTPEAELENVSQNVQYIGQDCEEANYLDEADEVDADLPEDNQWEQSFLSNSIIDSLFLKTEREGYNEQIQVNGNDAASKSTTENIPNTIPKDKIIFQGDGQGGDSSDSETGKKLLLTPNRRSTRINSKRKHSENENKTKNHININSSPPNNTKKHPTRANAQIDSGSSLKTPNKLNAKIQKKPKGLEQPNKIKLVSFDLNETTIHPIRLFTRPCPKSKKKSNCFFSSLQEISNSMHKEPSLNPVVVMERLTNKPLPLPQVAKNGQNVLDLKTTNKNHIKNQKKLRKPKGSKSEAEPLDDSQLAITINLSPVTVEEICEIPEKYPELSKPAEIVTEKTKMDSILKVQDNLKQQLDEPKTTSNDTLLKNETKPASQGISSEILLNKCSQTDFQSEQKTFKSVEVQTENSCNKCCCKTSANISKLEQKDDDIKNNEIYVNMSPVNSESFQVQATTSGTRANFNNCFATINNKTPTTQYSPDKRQASPSKTQESPFNVLPIKVESCSTPVEGPLSQYKALVKKILRRNQLVRSAPMSPKNSPLAISNNKSPHKSPFHKSPKKTLAKLPYISPFRKYPQKLLAKSLHKSPYKSPLIKSPLKSPVKSPYTSSSDGQLLSESPDKNKESASFFQIKRSVSRSKSRSRRMRLRAKRLQANFLAPDIFQNEFEPLKPAPTYKRLSKLLEPRPKLKKKTKLNCKLQQKESDISSQESTPKKVIRKFNVGGSDNENEDSDPFDSPISMKSVCRTPKSQCLTSNATPKSILKPSMKSARQLGASGKRKIRWDYGSPKIRKLNKIDDLFEQQHSATLKCMLENKALNNSELDAPSPKNGFGFEHDMSNLQDAKALHQYQYLTTMSLEVHCETREDLYPDPKQDGISGIFIYISNDCPDTFSKKKKLTKCLITISSIYPSLDTNSTCDYFLNEKELLNGFLKFYHEWNPDILVGYEIERVSWGYIINRGAALGLDMISLLSRLKTSEHKQYGRNRESWDGQIGGRIVLNLWRLLRHEITVQSYTYENAVYHVLHRRACKFGFATLTEYWNHPAERWRVLEYYADRVKSSFDIIETLDIINRTSELARLFGILFYEIFSRGSQWRVESMMLRLTKSRNLIPVSPCIAQRSRMRAPEFLPLILEPISNYYTDPVAVLDFQSLYPSMIMAYNYDYATILGRVEHLGKTGRFELGCVDNEVSPSILETLKDFIHISPAGVAFVKSSVCKGVLPEMLEQILDTRQMVKRSMKKWKNEGSTLKKILDSRQLGLKLIANVTYGYTSANFSGRMPCVDIADSVVSKGRETLQRAIQHVKSNFERWGGEVIYGDTDSIFVLFPGKSRSDAFRIGQEIAEEVTQLNPKPVKLKFEKIYQPCILQSKKRYVGYSYETEDQTEPLYDAKGIETVRRDGCPALKKVLEKALHILFTTNDKDKVKNFVQLQFKKLFTGRVSMMDYTFAKEYRGREGYKPGACVPSLEIARKVALLDPRAEPLPKQRVPYVIIYDKPTLPLIQLVRTQMEFANDYTLRLNAHYYIEKAMIPALNRCLALANMNVTNWYKSLPRKYLRNALEENKMNQGIIDDFISHSNCRRCDRKAEKETCDICDKDMQKTTSFLLQASFDLTKKLDTACQICVMCSGDDDKCENSDCPVFHKLLRYERDEHFNQNVLAKLKTFEI